jgi:tetrahydromethanopterin S-methyltransferase subunit B
MEIILIDQERNKVIDTCDAVVVKLHDHLILVDKSTQLELGLEPIVADIKQTNKSDHNT